MYLRFRKVCRRATLALLTAAALSSPAPARADFLLNSTGNTATENAGSTVSLEGTYNFAVLDRTTTNTSLPGASGNVFGAVGTYKQNSQGNFIPNGSGGFVVQSYVSGLDSKFTASPSSPLNKLDTSARYLYLIQITNNGPPNSTINTVTLFGIVPEITSFGVFSSPNNIALGDAKGTVTMTHDEGPDPPGDFTTNATENEPTVRPIIVSPGITPTLPQEIIPTSIAESGNNLVITFPSGELLEGQQSALIAFTSNVAPQNDGSFQFSEGTTTAAGAVPLPMPEPSGLVLALAGLGCVGLLCWRRRKAGLALA